MRKVIVSLLTIAALGCFSAIQAHAGCQTVNLQNQLGYVEGEVCFDSTTGLLKVAGSAFVVATGKEYTINADATVSGTPGNYTASGTIVLSDGATTKTITFSCPGTTTITAASSFVSRALTYTLTQRPPRPAPVFPIRMGSITRD